MEHETRESVFATRRSGVARDLDAIFTDRRDTPRSTSIVKIVKTRRRRGLMPAVIGIGVLVLAGASAGLALFVGDVSPTRPTTVAQKTSTVRKTALVPRPPVTLPDPIQASADTTSASSVSPPTVVASTSKTLPAPRKTEVQVERSGLGARSDNVRRPLRSADNCDDLPDDERAWCMRPSLLAAHRQLLTTYEAARRAGVDSEALARVQRRWTNLQRRASDRPDATLDRYRDLRLQLLDLIEERRSTGNDW